jgi:membrane associated rhomboid family serine protease
MEGITNQLLIGMQDDYAKTRIRYTMLIVLANAAVFILQIIIPQFTQTFALTPSVALRGAYWQFFTYMFLHGGILHIAINMFILMMFGILLEKSLGPRKFLTLYFVSGIFSAIFYLLLTGESSIARLGASGAVFAVLAGFAFKYPNSIVLVFFLFPLKAKYAMVLLGVIEFFSGFFDLQMGIANFGHLGGIIAGVLIMLYWRRKEQTKRSPQFRDLEFFWE